MRGERCSDQTISEDTSLAVVGSHTERAAKKRRTAALTTEATTVT
jgi:hypothetical protein